MPPALLRLEVGMFDVDVDNLGDACVVGSSRDIESRLLEDCVPSLIIILTRPIRKYYDLRETLCLLHWQMTRFSLSADTIKLKAARFPMSTVHSQFHVDILRYCGTIMVMSCRLSVSATSRHFHWDEGSVGIVEENRNPPQCQQQQNQPSEIHYEATILVIPPDHHLSKVGLEDQVIDRQP